MASQAQERAQGYGEERGGSPQLGVRDCVQLLPILVLAPGETSPERVKSPRVWGEEKHPQEHRPPQLQAEPSKGWSDPRLGALTPPNPEPPHNSQEGWEGPPRPQGDPTFGRGSPKQPQGPPAEGRHRVLGGGATQDPQLGGETQRVPKPGWGMHGAPCPHRTPNQGAHQAPEQHQHPRRTPKLPGDSVHPPQTPTGPPSQQWVPGGDPTPVPLGPQGAPLSPHTRVPRPVGAPGTSPRQQLPPTPGQHPPRPGDHRSHGRPREPADGGH